MNMVSKYKPTDKMAGLINDNIMLLMVMSRFGLSLGFGDKTVREVCDIQHVDCATFLAVANFISSDQSSYSSDDIPQFSIASLMEYLKNAHSYFLEFNFPLLRRKLIEAIDCSTSNNVAFLILKFFDEMVHNVRAHMEFENSEIFTYVTQLLQGKPSDKINIARFARKHPQTEDKVSELKNIIIKYYPECSNDNLLNAVLFDIFNCEQDLASHRQVEECLFVPAVAQLEKQLQNEK